LADVLVIDNVEAALNYTLNKVWFPGAGAGRFETGWHRDCFVRAAEARGSGAVFMSPSNSIQ
jgi:hypothetical protein